MNYFNQIHKINININQVFDFALEYCIGIENNKLKSTYFLYQHPEIDKTIKEYIKDKYSITEQQINEMEKSNIKQ